MVRTYEEYIKLLEAELKSHNYNELSESEISAFIKKYQFDKNQGMAVKGVLSDVRTLVNLHYQGKTAYSFGAINTSSTGSNARSVTMSHAYGLKPGQLIGLSGKTYTLENKAFSKGGEGEIFRLVGNKNQVIKIYFSSRVSKELEQKLCYMADNPPESSVLNQVAWPIDVVYDENMIFKGFVMPKLDINAELGDVYSYPPTKPESRIALNYKLIIAMNICTIINAVHGAGYIFGDFNPSNIGISMETGRVAFLDTDSYHIVLDEKNNKAFRCKVCKDGYVAPELLQQCELYKTDAYANAPLPTFTKETDNFALAIHIFRLLMNGYTPFNGIKETERASSASPGVGNQAIKRNLYCFKPGNKPQATAVPPVSILPDKIQELFGRAFIGGTKNPKNRPSASEWYFALAEYEKDLIKCSKYPYQHLYKKGLSSCPWCEADERYYQSISPISNQRLFPSPVVIPPTNTINNSSGVSGSAKPPYLTQTVTSTPVTNYNVQPSQGALVGCTNVKTSQGKIGIPMLNKIANVAGLLYSISWIVFIANICFCLAPFVNNGSISYNDSMIYVLNYKLYTASSLVSVALICFASNLKNTSSVGIVFSWIWGAITCFGVTTIRYSQMGFSSTTASNAWKFFGVLIVTFVATLISSAKLGDRIRVGAVNRQSCSKQRLGTFDVIFLVLLIGVSAFCIPLLLDLNRFYSFASNYNLFAIAVWVLPLVFFIMFMTSGSRNNTVEAWFCATMAVLFECVVLRLATMNPILAIILWLVLAGVALVLIVYIQLEIDNIVSKVTIFSFFIFFIVGAFTDLTILSNGVSAVGEGAHWWTVAPAIIDVIVAIFFSIVNDK
jgi:tetratricopeptide repeat protein